MKCFLLYGIVANSKTRVRCVFCGVYIPKANKCIEQHVNGAKHKENIALMAQHGMSCEADVVYCKPCKGYLPESDSVTKHIEGDSHGNWVVAMNNLVLGEFIRLTGYLATETENVFCEVCQSNIHCTLQNIEEHVNGLDHRSSVAEKLKPLNGIFKVENDDELWCKVCDVYIENTIPNVLDHIDDDDNHMEWFMEIEDIIEDHDISLVNYLANEFEKFAHCNKCNAEIICNAENLEHHVHSESHLNNFI